MSLPQSQAERLWRQFKLSHDRAMKIWPLNSLYFVIFLVIGFLATAPFVLGLMGDFWWIAGPLLAAWIAIIWIWGLRFAADSPEQFKSWSVADRIGATLIMLGQSLIGGILAVFLIGYLIQQWIAVILAVLIVGVVIFWAGRDPPKGKAGHEVKPVAPHPPTIAVQPGLQPPATSAEWFLHHISLVLFVGFGGLTLFDSIRLHNVALGWPAAAMTLSYAAFIWIHVVSPPKPGQAPPPIWYKLLATLITVVMTVVFLVVLAVIVEAIGELWIWVVPPVGLLVLVIALNWGNPPPNARMAAGHRHKQHDRLVG
jgi:hypothetical protein